MVLLVCTDALSIYKCSWQDHVMHTLVRLATQAGWLDARLQQLMASLFRNKRNHQSSSMPGSSCRRPQKSSGVLPQTTPQALMTRARSQVDQAVQDSPPMTVCIMRPDV